MADTMAQLKTQAVGEWDMVGDCFFSREALYDMSWGDFELEDKRLACAPFGGPIATIRDERRIVLVTHGSSAAAAGGGLKPVLRTFTAAGAPLGAAVWEGGRLVEWGWSEEQQLVVVEASGKVTLYSPFAEKLREFSFGTTVERDGVAAAKVYGSGVVVVTEPRPALVGAAAPSRSASAASASAAAATDGGGGGAKLAVEPCEIWLVSDLRDPRPVRLKSPPKEAYRAAAAAAAAAGGAAAGTSTGATAAAGGAAVGLTGLGGLGRPGLPNCLAVLDPRHTPSRVVEVVAAVGGSLWLLDSASADDPQPEALRRCGAAVHLEVSPDGAFVAVYTGEDRLMVLSADLTRQLTEFETRGADAPPTGLHWVGSDAVLLAWPDTAVLVGPYGDTVQWSFSEDLTAVISEVDGCRLLLGRSVQQLARKVPDSCVQLWDARALYDEQNPRCDRILRDIQDSGPASLPAAVSTCIQAAGHDLTPQRQRALMKAAAYGRPFCPPDFPRQLMYGVACRLRVLTAVRDPRVGLPLTMTQLEALSLPVLVARLISYRQWLLAYRIAGALRNIPGGLATATGGAAGGGAGGGGGHPVPPMGQDQVLVQWACAKISSASTSAAPVDDEQLKDSIVAKLKGCPQVRYAPLAAHALVVGRRRLALRLLEEERSAAQQVPLLLDLAVGPGTAGAGAAGRLGGRGVPAAPYSDLDESGEGGREEVLQRALRKAVESGDTDLVYLVLFRIYRTLPLPEFWALVAPLRPARNLFIKYCKSKEPALLETILTAAVTGGVGGGGAAAGAGGSAAAGAAAAAAAFPPAVAAAELAGLQLREALEAEIQQVAAAGGRGSAGAEAAATKLATSLADVAQKYGQSKECAFQSKAVAEMGGLLREQVKLERETGQRLFVGLSLAGTLRTAIRAAAALKKQFSVTDRRFTWLKVWTLAEARDWEALEGFASELKKSPIGWEPWVEAAKKWNAPLDYTARLIGRLPDSPSKAEQYSVLGLAREAAEVAAKIKDSDLFARIQSAVAAGSPAALAIAQIKERFQSTFR